MNRIKQIATGCILLAALSVCAYGQGGKVDRYGSSRPTAKQLLDKYAETQDKLRSFVVKDICKEVRTSAKTGRVETIITSAEFRTDGNRVSFRAETKSDDQRYNGLRWRWLWDGKVFVETDRAKAGQMHNVIIRNHDRYKRHNVQAWHGAPLMGVMGNDIEPIASIMRDAKVLTLDDELKSMGGAKCYVVNAVTRYGKYTIWIDPGHGYHIAGAKVVKEPGDILMERPVDIKYRRVSFVLKNVRFEKVGDVWVPMEADYAYNFVNKEGKVSKNRMHYERTEIALYPDHKTMASFIPNNIKNGSPVYIESLEHIKYTWQDGAISDADGNKVDLKKILDEIKKGGNQF